VKLNQYGCPARVRFRIIEEIVSSTGVKYDFADSYASIIGVQKYIDSRNAGIVQMYAGFPVKCRFYLISADHRPVGSQLAEDLWKEALTLKELAEYLDD
jgi:hypothetical protein